MRSELRAQMASPGRRETRLAVAPAAPTEAQGACVRPAKGTPSGRADVRARRWLGRWGALVLVLGLASACRGADARGAVDVSGGGVFYYSRANLYVHPEGLSQPIDRAVADRRERTGDPAYYIAVYDDAARLVELEKRFGGARVFLVRYTYTADGVFERSVIGDHNNQPAQETP